MRLSRLAWLLALPLAGCMGTPPPAPIEARTPSPGTVTRDNPAGDAESPVDAALSRLLNEPIGKKSDKFRTLGPRLADAANWKRIRFFGYPTRAAYRYGKDNYAIAVITYEEAEGDDSPTACVERFVKEAHGIAVSFDIDVGPIDREVYSHPRGIEALDMAEVKAAEQAWEKELAERRRLAREHLKRWRAERAKRLAEARARAAQRKRQREAELERARQAGEAEGGAEPERADAAAEELPEAAAQGEAAPAESSKDPRGENAKRAPVRRLPPLRFHFSRALQARARAVHPVRKMWLDARSTQTEMPVVLASGSQSTLTSRDRYLVAIAGYRSWPGTCLVQGFAVKVGTDPVLAQRVRERWIGEIAPELQWRASLREQPPIQNR